MRDRLARTGTIPDADLSDPERAALRALGAKRMSGPGAPWWAVGERKRLALLAEIENERYQPYRRPDPDAAAFDG